MTTDERVHEIIAGARKVMADFGVRRATVGDVASAVGVSRQTVYEYFPSREALIQAALKSGARDLILHGIAEAEKVGGTPAERLAVLLSVSMGFLRTSLLWSTPGKRKELVAYVTLEDGVYLGAGIEAMLAALRRWWPDVEEERLRRAADTLARTLVSHGLSPEDGETTRISAELADLVARGLA